MGQILHGSATTTHAIRAAIRYVASLAIRHRVAFSPIRIVGSLSHSDLS